MGAAGLIGYLVFSPTEIFAPPRIVSIHKGDSMTTAARKLARAGVVRSQMAFVVVANIVVDILYSVLDARVRVS